MPSEIVLLARPTRSRSHRLLVALLALVLSVPAVVVSPALAAPPEHAKGGGGDTADDDDGGKCHPKKGCSEDAAADTTPPTLSVASPAEGDTVAASVTVSGSAQDDTEVASVEVGVDGGPFELAAGTSSWTHDLDTGAWGDGSHGITVRATDAAGNARDVVVTVNVDTVAPTVAIETPNGGATVDGVVEVAGTASDSSGVSQITVLVDGAPHAGIDGASTWSVELDTSGWSAGDHQISVQAEDMAGNVGLDETIVHVEAGTVPSEETVTNGELTWTRQRLEHPSFPGEDLTALQYGRMARHGDVDAVLYRDTWTGHRGVHLRDLASGTSRFVELPAGSSGWAAARLAMSSSQDLWVLSGLGTDITLRRFVLGSTDTSGLPTSASLADEIALPATDARVGDLLALESGAVVAVWRDLAANEYRIAYATPADGLVEVEAVTFMPTGSSNQVAAQHPADGAVWVFSNADSWSSIGALRLREDGSGLSLEYAEGSFIGSQHGEFDADPEHPKLAVANDEASGQLVLAYQSADRWRYSTDPWVVASTVALARVSADGALGFEASPVRAERISWLGVTVADGATWLAYRPVDETTLTYTNIHVVRSLESSWSQPADLGETVGTQDPVLYDPAGRSFALQLADGGLHRFEFAP